MVDQNRVMCRTLYHITKVMSDLEFIANVANSHIENVLDVTFVSD